MKKDLVYLLLPMLFLYSGFVSAQENYQQEIQEYRTEKNARFLDPARSPLPADDIAAFEELEYFPIKEEYKISAVIHPSDEEEIIHLNTNGNDKISLRQYGDIEFTLDGKSYTMHVYRKDDLPEFAGSSEELFLPFLDQSNGDETNQQGRYIAVDLPDEGLRTMVDFNKSMNPFSAYNEDLESPLPPETNSLTIEMLAGERKYEDR